MAVIAMTREMGSLGKDVAAGLADQLALTVVHHELVEQHLAERLGVKESTVHRYLEGEASLLERWKIDKEKLSRYTARKSSNSREKATSSYAAGGQLPSYEPCRMCCAYAYAPRCPPASG